MEINILNARMTKDPENGYVGSVEFEVVGHKKSYEIVLQSKNGKEWGYGLHYLNGSGGDEEIEAVDERIEEDDELFDRFVQAARDALKS